MMHASSLKTFSKLLRPYPSTFFRPLVAPTFCSWKPNVPKYRSTIKGETFHMAHPTWDLDDLANVKQTHREPKGIRDNLAWFVIKFIRRAFDFLSGYDPKKPTESTYMARFIFLEVIAGVPGMIGGMARHMKSIVTMREDKGWIHHLLEEAENERMHLFVYLDVRQPGYLLRAGLVLGQAAFIVAYSLLYLLSSKTAHRFVGYLEEEAVKTYSWCLEEIDQGMLPGWENLPAPQSAIEYWSMPQNSTFRDVIAVVRADEVMHREVNHRLADLKDTDPMDSITISPEDVAAGKTETKEKTS